MWEKREQDWENERLARKKLLEEVLSTQKIQASLFLSHLSQLLNQFSLQIDQKLQVALKEREQLLKDRDEILHTLEGYQSQMKAKKEEEKERQIQTKNILQSQMDYKRQQEEEAERREKEEIERQQRAEQAFNDKHWSIAMDKFRLY